MFAFYEFLNNTLIWFQSGLYRYAQPWVPQNNRGQTKGAS